jgi:hypothetical protein
LLPFQEKVRKSELSECRHKVELELVFEKRGEERRGEERTNI